MILTNSYTRLPERFFARSALTPVAAPHLIALNRPLAEELGLDADWLAGPEGLAMLSGSEMPEGTEPVALAYAGHQFGQFVPQLGDGRALLLGDVIDRHGVRRDVQLKGSGPTPFSRRGDGRAALGPVLREYLVSEAMAALGVPTTRALAAVTTGETVLRMTALPGAVLARVAASHLRVGTFQFFAVRDDLDGLRALRDYAIERHYPEAREAANPTLAFYDAVVNAQARLIARWMSLGFIHGVMNTDNTSISGETIDYGPCAFLDEYDPGKVFSAIDQGGRYAYANQPRIGMWNLARLAETLLPLIDEDAERAVAAAQESLSRFLNYYENAHLAEMCAKLGLKTAEDGDKELIEGLFDLMAKSAADFTLTFRALSENPDSARALFSAPEDFEAWKARWKARLAREGTEDEARRAAMRAVNPAIIPRNHRIEEVIDAAVQREDFAPFEAMLAAVTTPYEERPDYARPPSPQERVWETFCGT
ncbi:protein adenylyltransferase SelO [Kozakia baliensis]|uniref:protein adenylyltransferase SelO n=1 Tax=Kozakia baliensis TaxID=153496 RepID=UPI00345C3D01